MKKLLIIPVITLFTAVNAQEKIEYPSCPVSPQEDVYFGTKVADPYRWLEDENSPETQKWVEDQNKITFDYLAKIPYRDKIKSRLSEVWNFPKYSAPFKEGKNYFYFKNNGLQNQSVLYVTNDLKKEGRVLLDPNTLDAAGTTSLSQLSVSPNGKYLAYGISKGGSDWNEAFIIDIETGKQLADHLKWIKFSGFAWEKDGFYYSKYDAPADETKQLSTKNEFQKVYYHKAGTDQKNDVLIYEDKERALRTFGSQVTDDKRYLVLYLSEGAGSTNAVYVKDLQNPEKGFIKVIDEFKNSYSVVDNIGKYLLVHTDKNAPKYRLVLIDPLNPDEKNWREIIPQKNDVLESVSLMKDKLVAKYMKDASSKIYTYDFKLNADQLAVGPEKEITLPAIGTLGSFSTDKEDSVAFYSFTSFTYPTTIFRYNINNNKSDVLFKSNVNFNPDDYVTKQEFFTSKDGTKVPMFIVHKKGLKMDGTNPTMLYGYGGFNISLTPSFSISNLILLENGGVYAMVTLRGGGEYGEEWHKSGMRLNKQNVFNDFIGAAEYLISKKYTSSSKLAISGRSNGGLLVGAAMTQRPELFKVAFPGVGVMDMLRFHKFTIGWAWVDEYGSSEDSTQFKNLYGFSPVHNIKANTCYPATMVTTADHDDRVVPAHSYKFAATLQEKQACANPTLIRIDVKAGHGAGKPTSMKIQEEADIWSFMFYNMGVTPKY